MNPTLVSILPSHPNEGWVSMNRYWEAVDRGSREYSGTEFQLRCPLKFAGICSPQTGKLRLAWQKKIVYPLKTRFTATSGVAHILDHSYAFLLKYLPRNVRTIVTVHDLLPLREPDGLSNQAIARFRERVEWVKKADQILSDSEATSRDLVELIGADVRKIRVLPLGSDPASQGQGDENLSFGSGGFIFSIGGYMKRKNLGILPEILAEVRRKHPGVKLVRAGARIPASLAADFESKCGADSLVELGQVSESILAALYRNANATIIPSRYEGFGLPVLEAMARGCPVVSADTTSLPEVGGDVPLYFDVDNPGEAADQLNRILEASPSWLADLKQRGEARAAEFTWDIHFSTLLDIYREVAAR